MSLRQDFTHLTELATRLERFTISSDPAGYTLMTRIELSMNGHPKAASWDNGPRSAEAWCQHHQRDVSACHQDGSPCVGYPVSGPSDPTGEAALRADRAADDERLYREHVKGALRLLRLAEDIAVRYPPTRKPNAYERSLTADANAPHCESCARHHIAKSMPWIQDVYDKCPNRSTVGDILPEPMYLCRFCYDHVWSRGCLPNLDELKFRETYQGQDRRLRCPHPKVERDEVA